MNTMTAPQAQNKTERRVTVHPVTLPRVVHSEWIKLRSLRSTRITLLVSFVLMAGLGVVTAAVTASQWSRLPAASRAGFDAVSTVLTGYQFAQLAVGVLGVVVISNEYSSGMIRATLAAVPRRLPVLWAKAGVFAIVTLVAMTAASLIAFAGGMALLSAHHLQVSLAAPGVARAVLGAGLYLAAVGLLGWAWVRCCGILPGRSLPWSARCCSCRCCPACWGRGSRPTSARTCPATPGRRCFTCTSRLARYRRGPGSR